MSTMKISFSGTGFRVQPLEWSRNLRYTTGLLPTQSLRLRKYLIGIPLWPVPKSSIIASLQMRNGWYSLAFLGTRRTPRLSKSRGQCSCITETAALVSLSRDTQPRSQKSRWMDTSPQRNCLVLPFGRRPGPRFVPSSANSIRS